MVSTATLAERFEPYDLLVELARGTLNDVQNQLSEWRQLGLIISPVLEAQLSEAKRQFGRAATSRDLPDEAALAAMASLRGSLQSGQLLTESYTAQVLEKRLEGGARLPTLLAVALNGYPKPQPWAATIPEIANAARVRCDWGSVSREAGRFHWELPDAQIHWCRRRRIVATAGPLVDLREGALPDWLWLWDGDVEEITNQAVELARAALARYRGKVAVWHLIQRPASAEILGLSEEDQVRLTARLLQVARQVDPDAHLVVDFDRPWADWMAGSTYQLGPLHLADSLARADLGLSGVGLEVAPGYAPWGSPMRGLFEFSRLLDLYALMNLPLHVSLALPSVPASAPSSHHARVDATSWPAAPDEGMQREWGERWFALAAAKPYVRTVTWLEVTDQSPLMFPGAGLIRRDGTAKPVVDWMRRFRHDVLGND
jgi:hypothetical protein